jgi:hypothetical protein
MIITQMAGSMSVHQAAAVKGGGQGRSDPARAPGKRQCSKWVGWKPLQAAAWACNEMAVTLLLSFA